MSDSKDFDMTPVINKGPTLGMRHVQAFLLFLGIVALYISRLNIGVAVVAMTNADTTNPDFPEYDWDEKEISYILSSFYWGYVVTQFVGGGLTKRFGAKTPIAVSVLCSAVLSALTPWFVSWGDWQAFCGLRIVQGLFQGTIFPCVFDHLAKWSPKQERNRLGALATNGIEFGTILALGLSGLIAEGPLGWPGISYVSAGLCFGWCVLWWIFASNNATESRFITEDEKIYIESSMDHSDDFHKKKIPTPWRAIIFSVPFHALLATRSAELWGLSTMQTQIPSYLNGVLGMDMKSNALFSALPFIAMWLLSLVFIVASDVIQRKKLLSLSVMRKSINTIALWIPAAFLIAIGFLDEDQKTLALILMTLGMGLNSGNTIGCSLNAIDLSPNHVGILIGIVNTLQSSMQLISPLVVGAIVTDRHNRNEWQIVFIISAVVFFVGNLVYLIWGSTKLQPWDADDFLMPSDAEFSRDKDAIHEDENAVAREKEYTNETNEKHSKIS